MPYPITGSDPANMEARLNVMRLGSSRLGYMDPTLRVTVNGVDRTASVMKEQSTITRTLGAAATAALIVDDSFTPSYGQEIKIGLGAIGNLIFAGHVVAVNQIYRGIEGNKYYALQCQDYRWLLNRRYVNATYGSDSIESVVNRLMTSFTSGFTTNHVQQGLGSVTNDTPFTMETVESALDRLAALVGADWYIDPYKDLHFGTSDAAPSPHDMTSSFHDFEGVALETDLSNVRTRVYVEGKATTIAQSPIQQLGPLTVQIPIAEVVIPIGGGSVRIGTLGVYSYFMFGWESGGSELTVDAAVGDTTITVASTSFSAAGSNWLKLGDQIISYNGKTGTVFQNIPASGVGSITAPVTAGATVQNQPVVSLTGTSTGDIVGTAVGTTVAFIVQADDAAAQAALAAIEGGDGIHELYVQDGRLTDSASERATAALTRYKSAVQRLRYRSHDPNTRPGASVVVNLGAPTSISGTFKIRSVTTSLFELGTDVHPWHTVEASAYGITLWDLYRRTLAAPVTITG